MEYNSNITYRNNIKIYNEASISNEYWSWKWELYDSSEYASSIKIFESEGEFPKKINFETGEELIGINIEEDFFNENMIGMVIVPWGGGLELRNAKIYNKNGYLAFSIDIWEYTGNSTDDFRVDIFFLKIPK